MAKAEAKQVARSSAPAGRKAGRKMAGGKKKSAKRRGGHAPFSADDLNCDELRLYYDLSDALRAFEAVMIFQFLSKDPGERVEFVVDVFGYIEDAYEGLVGLTPDGRVSNCEPYCSCGRRCCMCLPRGV